MNFPTNYLILEGPDLSGKTTFYSALHKESDFSWNIQDRSCLSMIIHAQQYSRSAAMHKENFKHELLNLNNRFVILLPDLQEIQQRYERRGDELQSLDSIKDLYGMFSDYALVLEKFPNVYVIRANSLEENVKDIKKKLLKMENASLDEISEIVLEYVSHSARQEATPLKFMLYDNGSFKYSEASIMLCDREKDYYDQILTGVLGKIKNEFAGNNPYNRQESITSRRFIFTNDSCISLVHASYRERLLDMHFVLRSSEVKTTFCYDLKFLYYLTKQVYKALGLCQNRDLVRLRFNLNSAHILE